MYSSGAYDWECYHQCYDCIMSYLSHCVELLKIQIGAQGIKLTETNSVCLGSLMNKVIKVDLPVHP